MINRIPQYLLRCKQIRKFSTISSSYDNLFSPRAKENVILMSSIVGIFGVGMGGISYIIGNAVDPIKRDVSKLEKDMVKIEEAVNEMSTKMDNKIEQMSTKTDNKIEQMSTKMDNVYYQVLKSNERLAVVETKQDLKE